jgi:hypothetical protein
MPGIYSQLELVPQGNDTWLVKPQRPIQKLTAHEAARAIRKSVWTIYRLYHQGILKGERPSPNGILIHAESLHSLIEASKDPEFWTHSR